MGEKIKKIRLKGNESFNFREGWLRKGMRCVEEEPCLFAKDDVMERLGVGSKMVRSIRFWLIASGLCEERYINSGRAKTVPGRDHLDALAVLYVIVSNLQGDRTAVSINELTNGRNNIGRIFNLTRVLINEYLDQLRAAGYITINRTAGLDMVYLKKAYSPKDIMIEYYEKAQVQ